ncbi:MAG: hypothetical protein K1X88_05175 [Nannocystaceae bacterium]|nr:hypothetical protein [Nannocystaceae bacterium]
MTERNATTTFLVCFSGHDEAEHRTSLRICLGVSPPGTDGRTERLGPYFFTVSLSNVRVQLPNPLPGTQPIVGTTNLHETLPLSQGDIESLRVWLNENTRAGDPKTHGKSNQ